MGKTLSTNQIIFSKKAAIRKLNNLLEGYIGNPDSNVQKKAYLISSWLQEFTSFVSFEEQFDPAKNISYKRGNIVKVNLGFNIGCELGGPHYAIVLDKHNKHSADTVTIIPLISVKDNKEIYERDVFLGNELYNTLHAKFISNVKSCRTHLDEIEKTRSMIEDLLSVLSKLPECEENGNKVRELERLRKSYESKSIDLEKELTQCEAWKKEIDMMKKGSIARIEQITTISKMRIWIPKKCTDVLYNISFSKNAMKKINNQLKELYVYDE